MKDARERLTALILFVVLVFYSTTIGWRGVLLIMDGRAAAVLLGIGVVLIPVVALGAIWRLIVFARDGSAMMAHQNAAPAEPQDALWRTALAHAEAHRIEGDRGAEQRAYRAAVQAWRQQQRGSSA